MDSDVITQVFKLMDSDDSNYVDRDEFAQFLTQRFASTELQRLQKVITDKLDVGKRGPTLAEEEHVIDLAFVPMANVTELIASIEAESSKDSDQWAVFEDSRFCDGLFRLFDAEHSELSPIEMPHLLVLSMMMKRHTTVQIGDIRYTPEYFYESSGAQVFSVSRQLRDERALFHFVRLLNHNATVQ